MGPHVREGVKEHDIHIKPKSYKLEFLGELVIYHGIRAWFGRRPWVISTSLQFESPYVYLKVYEGLCLVCLPLHVRVWGRT